MSWRISGQLELIVQNVYIVTAVKATGNILKNTTKGLNPKVYQFPS